ncbi:MAG: DUF3592 domain-containing protein [Pseudomonadota bacterium]
MFNPLRFLFHPITLGSGLMALGLWGVWHAYAVGVPQERAYVRQGVEVEARVTAKAAEPWLPGVEMPAPLDGFMPVTTRMTAAYETEAGPAAVTAEVAEGYFERFSEGDRVRVLHVPGTELARIMDGAPPSPKLALMGWAILAALGLGAFLIGVLGLFL